MPDELELNVPYTSTDLARLAFNISAKSFSNKRSMYLEKLSEYFEWTYEKRRYILTERKKEGTPARKSKFEIQQEIREPVHEVVRKYPLQTYKSIAQTMMMENVPFVKAHPQQEDTMTRYIKGVMETDYAVGDRVWSDITQLPIRPLTLDQRSYLSLLINQRNGASDEEINFMIKAMEDAGYITMDEAKDLMYENATRNYEEVMQKFKAKYHFRPKLVISWQEGIAFDADYILPPGKKK